MVQGSEVMQVQHTIFVLVPSITSWSMGVVPHPVYFILVFNLMVVS